MLSKPLLLLCILIGVVIGAGSAIAKTEQHIQSGDVSVQNGRDIWQDNYEPSHVYRVADAPVPL